MIKIKLSVGNTTNMNRSFLRVYYIEGKKNVADLTVTHLPIFSYGPMGIFITCTSQNSDIHSAHYQLFLQARISFVITQTLPSRLQDSQNVTSNLFICIGIQIYIRCPLVGLMVNPQHFYPLEIHKQISVILVDTSDTEIQIYVTCD